VARRGRPLEGRNRRRGLAAGPASPIGARETGRDVASELPAHVRVSLTGRGLRLIHASMRKAPPRFLPLAPPSSGTRTTALKKPPGGGRWSRHGKLPSLPGRGRTRSRGSQSTGLVKRAPPSNVLRLGRRRGEAARPGEGPRPPLPVDAGLAAARANHASVPSSGPSSGPASVPPSGHDRSTQTRANPQVSGGAGSSAC
jgi:hypothetical protein